MDRSKNNTITFPRASVDRFAHRAATSTLLQMVDERRASGQRALYFAYGANTNLGAMRTRCPDARPIGTYVLAGWELVFRGVADAVPVPGRNLIGALWSITPRCEAALDRFEGYPNLYVKGYLPLDLRKLTKHPKLPRSIDTLPRGSQVMLYKMAASYSVHPPSTGYLQTLIGGYDTFQMPRAQLKSALQVALAREACNE